MARRVSFQSLALLAMTALVASSPTRAAAEQEPLPSLLVGYSFDDSNVATGPDTFRVFENSRGTVNLSRQFRLSGYNSVEIRDVAGDRNFPELQGYFPMRRDGVLYAHFGLLLTDPAESFNIALAGPRGFRLGADGIAFWLSIVDGTLVHYSDSMPKRLFLPRPFVWYHVDLFVDVVAGRYDLRIQEEGTGEPEVDLRNQLNAAAQPGSAIDKFSFIGDRGEDTSRVVYYVDDVVLGTDAAVHLHEFVAPGRRRLFVDALAELRRELGEGVRCLPAASLADLGLGASAIEVVRETPGLQRLSHIGENTPIEVPVALEPGSAAETAVRAALAWRAGCQALQFGNASAAGELFGDAIELAPGSRIFEAAYVLALAQGGHWQQVDEWLAWLTSEWRDDPRLVVLAARVWAARGDLDQANRWLRPDAHSLLSMAVAQVTRPSERAYGALTEDPVQVERLRRTLIPVHYYFVLLWQQRFQAAQDYADEMAGVLQQSGQPARDWQERAADAAFYAGSEQEARTLYESLLDPDGGPARILLKLSDVSWALGDLETERHLREAIYGRLAED